MSSEPNRIGRISLEISIIIEKAKKRKNQMTDCLPLFSLSRSYRIVCRSAVLMSTDRSAQVLIAK